MFLLFGCELKKVKTEETVVASVYGEEFLYLSELMEALPSSLSSEDSAAIAEKIINDWVRKKVVYRKAKLNLAKDNELSRKVREYEEMLYIHSYEQKLLEKLLQQNDMKESVSAQSISNYYEQHKEELKLSAPIVKAFLIQISNEVSNKDKVLLNLNSGREEDIEELKDYSFQFANRFSFGEEWVSLNSIKMELPEKNEIKDENLLSNRTVQFSDSLFTYYYKLIESVGEGAIPPLEFVSEKIKDLLLQKKRKEIIIEIRNNLYNEALEKNKIEIYDK